MCIPEVNVDEVFEALKELVKLEKDWVPSTQGTSLYIRPAIVATDPYIGVRASSTYRFFIILSPVGAYYKEGFNPVKIWITKDYVRAVVGGLGEAKTAANYAASLYAGEEAHKQGYTQVLWLDGVERKYIEEVGSMNIFFVIGDELATPSLTGSILNGITRQSVIKIASEKWGMKVSERRISIDEIMEAHDKGILREAFGTGTAAVVSPVGHIKYAEREITINNGEVGAVAKRAFDTITGIQYGRIEDSFGWVEKL
jgi:branched-chain amino acid aminotransferase